MGKFTRSFPKNEWIILVSFVYEPVYLWCANARGLAYVSSVVPGLTVWSLLAQLRPRGMAPPPCSRLRNASAGQGLPQSQPGKWHRPSAVAQKRHQQRPKGEAPKQRASEQPVFTHLSFDRACMKMWCSLNRDSVNRCREYDRCGVASPWPMSRKIFLGKLLISLHLGKIPLVPYHNERSWDLEDLDSSNVGICRVTSESSQSSFAYLNHSKLGVS